MADREYILKEIRKVFQEQDDVDWSNPPKAKETKKTPAVTVKGPTDKTKTTKTDIVAPKAGEGALSDEDAGDLEKAYKKKPTSRALKLIARDIEKCQPWFDSIEDLKIFTCLTIMGESPCEFNVRKNSVGNSVFSVLRNWLEGPSSSFSLDASDNDKAKERFNYIRDKILGNQRNFINNIKKYQKTIDKNEHSLLPRSLFHGPTQDWANGLNYDWPLEERVYSFYGGNYTDRTIINFSFIGIKPPHKTPLIYISSSERPDVKMDTTVLDYIHAAGYFNFVRSPGDGINSIPKGVHAAGILRLGNLHFNQLTAVLVKIFKPLQKPII